MLERLRPPLNCPDPNGMFRRQAGRLALFRPRAALEQYWTHHWKDEGRRERLLEKNRGKELAEYEALFRRYLSENGIILEAGCGLGQVVSALAKRGARVKGIEFDAEVVRFVNERFPDLDVAVGDVKALAIPDRSISTYISLGVVEHFPEGPEAALREARRILTPDGFALISVPLLNRARANHLERLSEQDGADRAELAFYQYYFSAPEFTTLAQGAGLELIEWSGIFAETHLRTEHPMFSRLWRSRLGRSRLREPLRRAAANAPDWAARRYGHMAMFVFKPA